MPSRRTRPAASPPPAMPGTSRGPPRLQAAGAVEPFIQLDPSRHPQQLWSARPKEHELPQPPSCACDASCNASSPPAARLDEPLRKEKLGWSWSRAPRRVLPFSIVAGKRRSQPHTSSAMEGCRPERHQGTPRPPDLLQSSARPPDPPSSGRFPPTPSLGPPVSLSSASPGKLLLPLFFR